MKRKQHVITANRGLTGHTGNGRLGFIHQPGWQTDTLIIAFFMISVDESHYLTHISRLGRMSFKAY